ncbi:MAG: Na/Pi cotransporter family protein [Acutalibacteraceae bacterium]
MDIFNFISLFGGLSFFLYGMTVMSGGLEKMSGSKLEKTLKKMTSNRIKSLALGAGITIAIQSSSAMTVMLVGLVNSGIMQTAQTVGVIMGSNIGTTLTAWLTAAAGIESGNLFMRLLKPENFAPIFAFIGIVMIMTSKKQRRRDLGGIFVGFSVLMYGMTLMSDSMAPLAQSEQFSSVLTAFSNPVFGVLVGTAVTGIIQSSAASVGILQALALTGNISYSMAIPIIMGQNIGTCVTSLISSIGVNKNAKRVAAVHIAFNVIGTAIFLALFCLLGYFGLIPFADRPVGTVGIAACHTVFNMATTLLLLPFSGMLVKIAEFFVRDGKRGGKSGGDPAHGQPVTDRPLIDERLFNTPSFAISELINHGCKMAKIAGEAVLAAARLTDGFDEKLCETVRSEEERLDLYEDKLGTALVRLCAEQLSERDSREVSKLLHAIGDFERLGDHALNLVCAAEEIRSKSIVFSESAKIELHTLSAAVCEITERTIDAFVSESRDGARRVEPLEQVIDGLIASIKLRHIGRLKQGGCSIEVGFVLSDLLTNFERISDHCSNIAVAVIEIGRNEFDTHRYLSHVKAGGSEQFDRDFAEFESKYQL